MQSFNRTLRAVSACQDLVFALILTSHLLDSGSILCRVIPTAKLFLAQVKFGSELDNLAFDFFLVAAACALPAPRAYHRAQHCT